MQINSSFNNAVSGIQRSINRVEKVSNDIARNGTTDTADPAKEAESLVELKEQQRNVEASAKVIKTADQMLGSILDIRV